MRSIENTFQPIVNLVVAGILRNFSKSDSAAISRFFSLWALRSQYRNAPEDVRFNELVGDNLTIEEQENLEANGYLFLRPDGKIPGRMINGTAFPMRLNKHIANYIGNGRWGIVRAREGEFIVPDSPGRTITPITPQICLMLSQPNGELRMDQVAHVNRVLRDEARAYYFARDLDFCPF